VQLVERNGRISRGAEAVFRTLGRAPGLRALAWLGRAPLVLGIAEVVYRFVASHRRGFARIDRWLTGRAARPATHARIRRAFFAALGVTCLAAFTSLRRQVLGLYGSRGILPVRDRVRPAARLGRRALRFVPTIFLRDASDEALLDAARHGQKLSIALALGIEPRLTSSLLWTYYLSFVSIGGAFLNFQWDALLLETLLHAAIVAPPSTRRRRAEEPTALAVALMRFLAFRLHYESGLVKRRSPDACWRDGTALCHYYETAPLPTRIGWLAHHLPERFQRFATRAAMDIELCAPFLAFGPRTVRVAGFGLLTGFQALIALTGNYGFFNLLAIALNLWLLDDGVLAPRRERPIRSAPTRTALGVDLASLALGTAAASSLASVWAERRAIPAWRERVLEAIVPFRSVNTYGPFSVMTVERPEIVVEGSSDGVEWRAYEFAYKIDDVARAPRWVAPHQPRLDWQMWFAALDGVQPWFVEFAGRLLEGSPDVLALLASNPFAGEPPRYVRARMFRYRETSLAERRASGAWWKREYVGTYLPPVTLARNST
jgi:hypothetical protein